MLQTIRDRLTGPVVWFVVGLIGVPFAFFGIQSFRNGGGDPTVAKVGSEKITQSKLQRRNEQRYSQFLQQHGGTLPDNFDRAAFRQQTLDEMIDQSAMHEFGQDAGYRIGDQSLLGFLQEIPFFQKDGKFSVEVYHEKLQTQANLTPETFEANVREQMVSDQISGSVQDSAIATAADGWDAFRLERQTRRIGIAQISAASFKDKAQATDEQIAARYETDKGQYQSPERIKLAYVELARDTITVTDTPTTEQLKALYDETKDTRFANPEERHARHILIPFGPDKAASKKKAEALLAEIEAGKDFATEAKENSGDPGSKVQGGDLGWVRKGMMVPAFEKALFDMKSGELTGPVETNFGWHLIKLDEIREPGIKPFEDPSVVPELTDAWRGREAAKKFQDLSTQLESAAFEKSDLEAVAKEMNLEIKKTDWLTRAGAEEGIGAAEGVKQVAFSDEIVNQNANSKPIATDADHLVVVHKSEYEAVRQRPLEEVKDRVRSAVVADAAAELAKKEAEALIADLKAGKALAAAAAAHQATIKFEGDANRHQKDVEPTALNEAFRMPRTDATPEYRTVGLAGGDVAVVALSAVTDPVKPEGPTALLLTQAQAAARDQISAVELEAYRKAVQKQVKIKRNELPPDDSQEPGT